MKELRFKGVLSGGCDSVELVGASDKWWGEGIWTWTRDGVHRDFRVVFRVDGGVSEVKPFFVIIGESGSLFWERSSREFLTAGGHFRCLKCLSRAV